jgi:hypothetical protein
MAATPAAVADLGTPIVTSTADIRDGLTIATDQGVRNSAAWSGVRQRRH